MTNKQAKTLRSLKAIENKAYAAAVIARGFTTSVEAFAAHGNDATYAAWVNAADAVRSFCNTLPIYGGR